MRLKRTMGTNILTEALQHHEAGRLEKAEALYRKILAQEPNQPDALHLLGVLAHQRGDCEGAVTLIRQAIAGNPSAPTFHMHLGQALMALGQMEEAVRHYKTALKFEPSLTPARHQLANTLLALGRLEEAGPHYEALLALEPTNVEFLAKLGAIKSDCGHMKEACTYFEAALRQLPDNALIQTGLFHALARIQPEAYEAHHAALMEKGFAFPDIAHQIFARPAAGLLKQKYRIDWKATEVDLKCKDDLLSDGLLRALLKKTVNADGELELFLTRLRRQFFLAEGMAEAHFPFLSALAEQGFNNEYVFWVSEEEEAKWAALKADIESNLASAALLDEAFFRKLLLFALYAPLHTLAIAEKLKDVSLATWPDYLQPIVQRTLLDWFEEQEIKDEIPSLTKIEDATSRAVQSQYEENPYPRWLSIDREPPSTLAGTMAQLHPQVTLPSFLKEPPLEVLIAGAGTGKHVILRALSYGDAKITAVDLSKSSLAYARRMAKALNIKNIEFHQGDILDLDCLGRQFPVIECAGVLHHMKEPEKGWSVLTRLLRPGGFMLMGLYGEAARKDIVQARKRIQELDFQPTAKDIRNFRRDMLLGKYEDFSALMVFHDFFALSGCRDLIFHVQEHRYTIPEIQKMIHDQSLDFLGFQFYEGALSIKNLYRKEYPADPNMTDFSSWERFEEAHPEIFIEMLGYLFWCRKPVAN